MMQEVKQRQITDEYDQLAFATGNDRTIIEKLTTANAELTAMSATLVAQLAETKKALKRLADTYQHRKLMQKERQDKYNKRFDSNGYCWSHDYKVTKTHTCRTCTDKKLRHQDGATRTNTMGGSLLNKNWTHPYLM